MPKFGKKVPHLRCNLHTSFKVKLSKVRVTDGRGIPHWPNRAATMLVNTSKLPSFVCSKFTSDFVGDGYTNYSSRYTETRDSGDSPRQLFGEYDLQYKFSVSAEGA